MSIPVKDTESFVVTESVLLDILIAIFFYFLFFYGLFNTQIPSGGRVIFFERMLLITIIPAIVYTYKAVKNRTHLKINRDGIYVGNFFLTNWENFGSANISQEQEVGSIQDNFILVINYYRENLGYYEKKVPLTNTQNKSEEEVIAAIEHFRNLAVKHQRGDSTQAGKTGHL